MTVLISLFDNPILQDLSEMNRRQIFMSLDKTGVDIIGCSKKVIKLQCITICYCSTRDFAQLLEK